MIVHREQSQSDDLLLPFLQANEAEAQEILAVLIAEHVEPLVKQIVRRKLCPGRSRSDLRRLQDAEDVSREAIVNVIRRLRAARTDSIRPAIDSLGSYVAVTAYNACNEYVRQKYPERHRLSNRLRYLLTHQECFDLWEGDGRQWLCGLRSWRETAIPRPTGDAGRSLQDCSGALGRMARAELLSGDLMPLLNQMFNCVGRPCQFDELVNTLADSCGLNSVSRAETIRDEASLNEAHSPDQSLVVRIELRAYLRRLWSEICQLPLPQRCALLLNVRDPNDQDIITMLVDTYVATIRQIAEALAMPVAEFVELWKELPCDDAAIARRVGVTRTQVVSLRQSARRRLARRMNDMDEIRTRPKH